jgi:hypothetical protein
MASEGPQALPESAPVSVSVPVPVKTGPPKKGEGKPPSIAQKGLTLSKIPVKLSSFLPVPANPPTMVADKALLEAQKVARDIKKSSQAAVKGGRSIKGVELIYSADVKAAAEPVAEKQAGLLDSFFGEAAEPAPSAEPVPEAEAPSYKVSKSVSEEDAAEAVEAGEGDEGFNFFAGKSKPVKKIEAANLFKPDELLPSESEKFKEISTAVESKLSTDPIKVHPKDNIFMPINRRGIHRFIIEAYRTYILSKPREDPVGNACEQMSKVSSSTITNFAYQEFVRDYMQRGSPYRGILVYHGLGSGKTCTSIATMEGLRYGGSKKIFVMTPATLSGNYHKELSLCGYYAFKKDNHWEQVAVPENNAGNGLDDTSSQFLFLTNNYGLSSDYLQKKYRKQKLNKNKFWVADPSRPVNFDTLEPAQKQEIEEQIKAHMDDRFEFIHYNGLREAKVREWICGSATNPNPGNLFDNSVIVIDEVHNLIRTIVGSDLETIYKTEPRENKKNDAAWKANYQENAKICAMPRKYRIAYGVYRLLCDAVGCKIIALSGTPIINKPHEIAILSNILAGDRRIAKIPLNPAVNEEKLEQILMMNPSIDFYSFTNSKTADGVAFRQLLITAVPSGMRKVVTETGEFKGFMRLDEEEPDMRERNLPMWFDRDVLPSLGGSVSTLGPPIYNSLPQLPDTEKEFVESFVDKEKLIIRNNISLRARLTGLISYYKGSKKELVATVTKDEVVLLDMSDWQLSKYLAERKDEIDSETKPAVVVPGARAIAGLTLFEADLYAQAVKTVSSAFKIFSRASCNFVFPDGIVRPRPADSKKAAALLGVKEEGEVEGDGDNEAKELRAAQQLEISQTTRAAVKLESFLEEDDDQKEEQAVAAAAEAEVEGEVRQVALEYGEQLKESLNQLRARAADIFPLEKLRDFSPKYVAILERIRQSKGPVLIYSQFKTLEGLGVFATACDYQTDPGYVRLDIVKSEEGWVLAESLKAPENKGKERYILYTGDDSADKREILRDIFNWDIKKLPASLKKQLRILAGGFPNNFAGKICRMFMITQSGAEGISLKNVRQVHIMEPFWNYVRLEQVQGRAIRICSHKDLPMAERTVEVFTYLMKFSEQQKKDRKVDETIATRDKGLTTDQIIYTLMMTKRRLSEQIFEVMKSSAIDCTLNALEHGSKSCFMIASGGPLFLYHPDYKEDIKEAQSQYRVKDDEPAEAPVVEEAPAAPPVEEAPPVEAQPEAPPSPPVEEAPAPPAVEEPPPQQELRNNAFPSLATNAGRLNEGAGPKLTV